MNICVVFLCKDLTRNLSSFANEIKRKLPHDVWVVIDNTQSLNNLESEDLFYSYACEDTECINSGYKGCNITGNETHIKKEIIAWDKFLYKFCNNNKYDFYWVFEEDVFIPSIDVLDRLIKKSTVYDLLAANNFQKNYLANDWHWPHIVNKIGPPYYHSMVSACGISKNLLGIIKTFVDKSKTLFHIEAMFNTIAMQNQLVVGALMELKSVVWMGKWGIDEFLLLPNNIFHPIKETNDITHDKLRQDIIDAKASKYKPKNNLPDFLR